MKRHYDWEEIKRKIQEIGKQQPGITYKQLSGKLGIPVSTLHDNVSLSGIRLESSGENAPQSPQELAKRAGVDLTKFNIKSFNYSVREDDFGDLHYNSRLSLDPIAKTLTLTPVNVTIDPRFVAPDKTKESEEIVTLVIPDIHFGFGEYGPMHDDHALRGLLEYISTHVLDNIVFLGDLLDLTEFTDKFVQQPAHVKTTQQAIDVCAEFLATVQAMAPEASIIILEGNHDARMTMQLRKHLMAIAGLRQANTVAGIDIAYFLGLESLGIKYVNNWPNNFVQFGDVKIVHGDVVGQAPGQTVSKMLERYNQSTIFGHIHRREYAETTVWSDKLGKYKTIFSYSPGCLCRVDGAVPGSTVINGWRQGVGLLVRTKEGDEFIQDIPFNGKRFLT